MKKGEVQIRGAAAVQCRKRTETIVSRVVASMGEALREDPRGHQEVIRSWQPQGKVNERCQSAPVPALSEEH